MAVGLAVDTKSSEWGIETLQCNVPTQKTENLTAQSICT